MRFARELRATIEDEIRELIGSGEAQHVEYKAAEADAADIARAIVALANSGAALLLLGVGDARELWGLWYAQPSHIGSKIRMLPDMSSWRQCW